ncbi:hypothetical protein PISMIDRAFT_678160 [Pisolithus microcarpus 441]|uniref:Uncharacterized protein n=1 Tax=Pisolithus microcarpus 441 TaxID=765257 RepID=A0A0C9ZY11_9AGAM|nr:hypothetical protein PISMIDRAFT_678160 [Pisolithus microcarpus 441]
MDHVGVVAFGVDICRWTQLKLDQVQGSHPQTAVHAPCVAAIFVCPSIVNPISQCKGWKSISSNGDGLTGPSGTIRGMSNMRFPQNDRIVLETKEATTSLFCLRSMTKVTDWPKQALSLST